MQKGHRYPLGGNIGVLLGLYWEHGKENGNYFEWLSLMSHQSDRRLLAKLHTAIKEVKRHGEVSTNEGQRR